MKIVSNCFRNFVLVSALACLPLTVFAQSNSSASDKMGSTNSNMSGTEKNGSMSATDKAFVRDAAEGGLAEVELGKLAAEKASSDDVKKFAQRMVDDHSKANDQLKEIAGKQGITLPQDMKPKEKALKARLSKLSDASFDKVYMEHMVKDHKADIAEFTKESEKGKDSDLKQFASSTLPTLKSHLQEAEQVEPKVVGSSTRASK